MENLCRIFASDGTPFFLHPLKPEEASTAAALSDRFVGKNMYPPEMLKNLPDMPGHFFYLICRENGSPVGYFYYYLTDSAGAAAKMKLPQEKIAALCPTEGKTPVIGYLQSIGIDPSCRGRGLSDAVIAFAMETLRCLCASLALGVCWKMGEKIPMERTLTSLGFTYLTDAEKIWYDVPDLICPCCGGRCRCDAAVYYKIIEKENRA